MTRRHGICTHALLLLVLSLGLGLAGCEGDDGSDGRDGMDGSDGAPGADGAPGSDGISCWDLNENGIADPEEDLNGDGVVNVEDCNALAYEPGNLHSGYFATNDYEGTESCTNCHGWDADEFINTAHFKWEGFASGIAGHEGHIHGKQDILNNFCIAIPSNEGRCSHCHAGYGWADDTFDFEDPNNVDCLICHDQTGDYAKAPPAAGMPFPDIDLNAVAQSVANNAGTVRPASTRQNCIFCHAVAGGGNNVKHGDLALNIANTTREYDVHMGTDGGDLDCVDCHAVERDGNDEMVSHGIGGMAYHSLDEGDMRDCEDCHLPRATQHAGLSVEGIVASHTSLACQVCHIPAIARHTPTKTEWYWETAGDTARGVEYDPAFDPLLIPIYDPKKGSFVWSRDVRPELRYFNGTWYKALIGETDTYDPNDLPVTLGEPLGSWDDGESMIYPFKRMIGNQPADTGGYPVEGRIIVPHLFGTAGGPTPYWGNWDWVAALTEGAAAAGQDFSGTHGFVDTEMFLTVNHEVAPPEMAFGMDGDCGDCHFDDQIDWEALGWVAVPADGNPDPVIDGERPD